MATTTKGNGTPYKNEDSIKLYQTKSMEYYRKREIPKNEHRIDAHKVLVDKAYGMGNSAPYKIINNPIYAEPKSACTETYLVFGPFRDKQRCENVMSYIRTRFFRFLLLLKKPTQNSSKGSYQFVPMQDFSKPWTDEELYKKYDLDEKEINYIESMVREIE